MHSFFRLDLDDPGNAAFNVKSLSERISGTRPLNLDDPGNAIARSLRLGRDNGHLLARQSIQKRAFACIRPAQNRNKS
jgi:hypothetical protein